MKKITFIINPKCMYYNSFKKNVVLQQFPDSEYDIEFLETEYHNHAILLTQQAIENNPDMIVAVGGNATVNQIAVELIDTDISLAIIPTTEGSALARYLELPFDLITAIDCIKKSISQKIDIGKICDDDNEYYFLANCTTGLSADLSHKIGERPVQNFKDYILAFAKLVKNYKKPKPILIKFNEFEKKESFNEIFIGNIDRWGGPIKPIITQSKIDDGAFDIGIGINVSTKRMFEFIIKYFLSIPDRFLDESDTFKASHIYFQTTQPTKFQIDWIPITLNGDIDAYILEKKLNVIVPKIK